MAEQSTFYGTKVSGSQAQKGSGQPTAPVDPFADRASLIVRKLLVAPAGQLWTVRALAAESGVGLATTSRVLHALAGYGVVKLARKGRSMDVQLTDASALLDKWLATYHWTQNAYLSFAVPIGDLERFVKRLPKEFGKKIRWALTMHAGASLVSPHAMWNKVHVYVDVDDNAELVSVGAKLDATPDPTGRLVLMRPFYRSAVWSELRVIDSLPVVDDLQLVLDLWNYPLRGREQAEHLIEHKLGPRYYIYRGSSKSIGMTEVSKTQIDRLGDRLRSGDIAEADLKLLDQYRRTFVDPYEHVVQRIKGELGLEPTGRLVKSTPSILDKLRRESVRLSQMQDIAGCRLVVQDILIQDQVVESLLRIFDSATVMDRRQYPSHGYRAVHVIVSEKGVAVEIQVRTSLQHMWAEVSEKMSDVINPAIKYGGGDEQSIEMLSQMSAFVSRIELAEKYVAETSAQTVSGDSLERRISQEELMDFKRDMLEHFEDTLALMKGQEKKI